MSVRLEKKIYPKSIVCLAENGFLKINFQTFLYLFVIKKTGEQKILCSQRKV
jgi:hypothetical protein